MEPAQKCPACLKPKASASGGFVTQFVSVCRCNELYTTLESSEVLAQCESCKKPIKPARLGTLTQWIFSADYCRCAIPTLGESNSAGELRLPSFEIEEDDGVELPLAPGAFPLDRYQPKVKLGAGGSGTVYLSRDRLLGKKVAVKLLHQLDSKQLMSFQEEAKTTSRLRHENIIAILDFGPTESGIPYMVLEYVEHAETLDQLILRNGPLEPDLAMMIFSAVTKALAHAHHEGVFHRDLKPSNILLAISDDHGLIVKLIDFGVAKVKLDAQEATSEQSKTLAGTPSYMPPEMADGKKFDARSEIYSLGCVIFEALTGRPPFKGQTPLETIAMHANHRRPTLAEAAKREFSEDLERLLATCLNRSPSDRYPSAQAVSAAINSIIERELAAKKTDEETVTYNEPILSTSIAFAPPEPKKAPRAVLASAVIGLCILGAIAALTTSFVGPLWQSLQTSTPSASKKEAKRSSRRSTKPDGSYHTKNLESLFTIEPKEKAWNALQPLDDNDLKQLAETHRGDIKNLHLLPGEYEKITSAGWSAVATINPRILGVHQSTITDKDVAKFAKMPALRKLDISETEITDQAIRSLENCPLEDLNVRLCPNITDACAPSLAKIKTLKQLDLCHSKLGDATVQAVAPLNLQGLRLAGCKVTDRGLQFLSQTKTLQGLYVESVPITANSMKSLKGLDLIELNFDSCRTFDDECLNFVVDNYPNLRYLMLNNTSVTGKTVRRLAELKKLQSLHLASLSLKDEDVKPILDKLNLHDLDVAESDITDESLKRITRMKSLRKLQISRCNSLSGNAVKKLRPQIPEVIHATLEAPAEDAFKLLVGD